MGFLRPMECERTRHAVSAALDDELSAFERTLVAAHMRRCGPCRSFQNEITEATIALRELPLERLQLPIALPATRVARWQSVRRGVSTSAAAAVLLVALVGFATAPDRSSWRQDGALIASALDRPAGTNDLLIAVTRPTLASRQLDTIAYGAGGIGAYKPPLAPGA